MTRYYLKPDDINDVQLQKLATDKYLADTDAYIQNLALRLGLTTADIMLPLTFDAKKLAIAYLCKSISQDNIGINVQSNGYGVETDFYKVKWNTWAKEFDRLEPLVTAEVLSGQADTPEEFASTGIQVFRG